VANWLANIKPTDVYLEPSAGIGGLAVFGKAAGATVVVNELSKRRAGLLAEVLPDARMFNENAEQLNNILPDDVKPTVVVMNPPFSATVRGTANNSMNGADHIEQALKRLQPGGRLIAITGEGMAADRPAFKEWWAKIRKQYDVRANVGVNGDNYRKYGTSFDNQILVIDKSGPTTGEVITGKFDDLAEVITTLEGVRNDRPQANSSPEPTSVEQGGEGKTSAGVGDTGQPGGAGTSPPGAGNRSGGGTGAGGRSGGAGGSATSAGGNATSKGDGVGDAGRGRKRDTDAGKSGGTDNGARSGTGVDEPVGNAEKQTTGVALEQAEKINRGDISDSIYESYLPAKVKIAGAHPHPGLLVESAALAAVEPPDPAYTPNLPKEVIAKGLLSLPQLEAIVYAGQAHLQFLLNGMRRGFFIGDGTGVGKGREIAGIIFDNIRQGRKKHVWISEKPSLFNDAKRDYEGVTGGSDELFYIPEADAKIKEKTGILFLPYSTLRMGMSTAGTPPKPGVKKVQARIDQVADWLGPDFDGVIAFDEAHAMGNTGIGEKSKDASQQALAGLALQERFPKARIVYVSATGATEIGNLTYASRLGLWGEGTEFAGPAEFIGDIAKGGVASLELVSQHLKATGAYLARNLSFEGVEHARLEHKLNTDQREIYNELAKAWQIVLQNMEKALEQTGAKDAPGQKGRMRSQFWGTQQRFFNQIITSMLMPTVIEDAKAKLAAGQAIVFQMVNTNEAAQTRAVSKAEQEEQSLEEMDFTPKESLIEMVRNAYPVIQFEEHIDDEGKAYMKMSTDSNGEPVLNKEAVAARDELIHHIDKNLRVPENPLDMIIQEFGDDNVAEISGRSARYIRKEKEDGGYELVKQRRGRAIADAEASDFMADKRKVLVFTGAGSTGRSFHSDKGAINQRRREHYIVQSGWRADQTTQGFGRTHRSNEVNQPRYQLATTDITAQKRFITSIARRLDQLGALTKGQRETGSQGMFNAADNLEGPYSRGALRGLLEDIVSGRSELGREVLAEMGLDDITNPQNPTKLIESKVPETPKFLNRLLSLTLDRQNEVFDDFFKRIDAAVEVARQDGTLDKGIETVRAMSIKKVRDEVVFTDSRTKAQARFLELELVQPTIINEWADALEQARDDDFMGYYQRPSDGRVFVVVQRGSKVDSRGRPVNTGFTLGVKNKRAWTDALLTIEKGTDRSPKWKKLEKADAEKLWKAELDKTPRTHTEKLSMLSGALLSIWNRIEGDPKIKRAATADGERFIGRELRGKSLDATMKNLGVGSSISKMTPAEVLAELESGKAAKLANGWRITQARVRSEDRLEVSGAYFSDANLNIMRNQGLISERIDFKTRVFLPTGNVAVFERFVKDRPVVEIFDPKKGDPDAAEGDMPADMSRTPIDTILTEMERKAADGDEYRAHRVDVAKKLRAMLEAGEVSDERVAALLREVEKRQAGQYVKRLDRAERVRGAGIIMEKLHAAVRRGQIQEDALKFAQWLIEKNPDMVENLGISVRNSNESGIAGQYDGHNRVVRLFKGTSNPDTAVHEILHHTERMLPKVARDGIIDSWARALAKAHETAASAERTVLDAILAANEGRPAALKTLIAAKQFPYRLYHLVNPSEYWAVNATTILQNRMQKPRWVRLAYQWLTELLEFARGTLGLNNNWPVMRGLRAVLKSDGTEVTDKLLSEGTTANAVEIPGWKKYRVTITPKFPYRGNNVDERTVLAKSASEANKKVRHQMESEGHRFTHNDQASFRAEEVVKADHIGDVTEKVWDEAKLRGSTVNEVRAALENVPARAKEIGRDKATAEALPILEALYPEYKDGHGDYSWGGRDWPRIDYTILSQRLREFKADHIADAGKMVDSSETVDASGSQTDTPAFKRWFGDSKVVDASGGPKEISGFFVKANENISDGPPKWAEAAYALGVETNGTGINRESEIDYDSFNNESFTWGGRKTTKGDFLYSGPPEEQAAAAAFFGAGLRGLPMPRFVFAERMRELPASNVSTNYRDNFSENGLSVMGVTEPSGEAQDESDGSYALFNNGKMYRIAGFLHPYKRGSDGEPLLLLPKSLGKLGAQLKSATHNRGTFDSNDDSILNQIQKADEPSLFGGKRKMIDDMWRLTGAFVHPRMVASARKGIAKVFDIRDSMDQRAKEVISTLSDTYQPAMEKLDDDQKERVFAVLERGRLYGRFYGVGKGAIVSEDAEHKADIMPGETINLETDAEKAAYYAARRAMNKALDMYREQFVEDAGFDPKVITKATDVMALTTASAPAWSIWRWRWSRLSRPSAAATSRSAASVKSASGCARRARIPPPCTSRRSSLALRRAPSAWRRRSWSRISRITRKCRSATRRCGRSTRMPTSAWSIARSSRRRTRLIWPVSTDWLAWPTSTRKCGMTSTASCWRRPKRRASGSTCSARTKCPAIPSTSSAGWPTTWWAWAASSRAAGTPKRPRMPSPKSTRRTSAPMRSGIGITPTSRARSLPGCARSRSCTRSPATWPAR
jgi:hypothetical protein